MLPPPAGEPRGAFGSRSGVGRDSGVGLCLDVVIDMKGSLATAGGPLSVVGTAKAML